MFSLVAALFLVMASAFRVEETPRPDPQKTWALVVGVSGYTHAPPLQYAATDARDFAEFLKSPRGGGIPEDRFVLLLEDQATRRALEVELELMQERVREGDTVYIFIAGHGYVTKRGIGYYIPSDGSMKVPASTSVSFSVLKELIELGLAPASCRVLITDLCHSGGIGPEKSELAERIENLINAELLKLRKGDRGSFLNLLSSRPAEPSWESDELKKGVFSHALMEALNGKAVNAGDTVVRARELVAYLQSEVPRYTRGKQNPMVNEDFEPQLPVAFLDQPSQPPLSAQTETTAEAILTILNGDRASFSRVEWVDPKTKTAAVRQIPWHSRSFQIGALAPGEIEFVFFDMDNRPHRKAVKLEAGETSLDLLKITGKDSRSDPRGQVASLVPSAAIPPSAFARQTRAPVREGDATLLLQLDAGTEIYIDGHYFGLSPGKDRLLQFPALARGTHYVRLVTPGREQRFRAQLFPGPQLLDARTGELRAIAAIIRPPDEATVPRGVPEGSQQAYRNFHRALWKEELIQPSGRSAWDYYHQVRNSVPLELSELLKKKLIVAMGDRAQRTVLKYLRGGDVRWNAAPFEEGASLLERTRQLFKTNRQRESQQHFFSGRAFIEKGQYAQAVQELQRAVELDAEASHAYNALGLAFWKQDQLEQAVSPLQRAIALSPAWTYPRVTLALIYFEQRKYEEGEELFRSSIQLDEEDSTAYHGLGQLYFLLGRWEEAEKLLNQAIEYNPGNAYACETLGKLFQRRAQLRQAEQMFRLAIRLEPEEPSFHVSLAEVLQELGLLEEARSIFARILTQDPQNGQVLQAYAAFLASQKQTAEAERIFRQLIGSGSKDSNLRVRYGLLLQQVGKRADAEKEFRTALRLKPDNPYAHYNLAALYAAEGKIEGAERQLAEAIKVDRRYAAPRLLLGRIRLAQSRFGDALEEFRRALELSVDSHQRDELKNSLAEAEKHFVQQEILRARESSERGELSRAWEVYVKTLARAPDSYELRNAILEFYDRRLPEGFSLPAGSTVAQVLQTQFWTNQWRAERMWRAGERVEALALFLSALKTLSPAERPLVMAVDFNLGNELHGIHQVVYRWGLRALEMQNYAQALDIIDAAVAHSIFAPVPQLEPLTMDSLMFPADNPRPQSFADYEVLHHPDRRAHELYAAAYAGLGDPDKARQYRKAVSP